MTSQDYVIILLPGRVLPFSLYFRVLLLEAADNGDFAAVVQLDYKLPLIPLIMTIAPAAVVWPGPGWSWSSSRMVPLLTPLTL